MVEYLNVLAATGTASAMASAVAATNAILVFIAEPPLSSRGAGRAARGRRAPAHRGASDSIAIGASRQTPRFGPDSRAPERRGALPAV
ncbi:hypothetical protein STAQ_39720 [Allostella sp. ATCC 35155]|nr:hypothetical protein STAQ_39720 [Stella sp. ATCC 35155]